MAGPSASMATSKLLNLRNPAIQYLIRRQLLHPTVAAKPSTLTDAQSFNLISPENGSTNHSLNAKNFSIHGSNLCLYSQLPSGSCSVPAYRTYATRYPKDDAYEDYDDDDDDDEDEDSEIQDYSGSDFDDGDDVDFEDDYDGADEDPDVRPRRGRHRN